MLTSDSYTERYTKCLSLLSRLEGKLEEKKKRENDIANRMRHLKNNYVLCQMAAEGLSFCAIKSRDRVVSIIKSIVNESLRTFWDSCYLDVIFSPGRRNIFCDLRIRSTIDNEEIILDPLKSEGGSIWDIMGFSFRIAAIILARPERRRLILSDEGFSQLDKRNIPLAASYIRKCCEDLGFQIILITHEPSFTEYAHNVIKIGECK